MKAKKKVRYSIVLLALNTICERGKVISGCFICFSSGFTPKKSDTQFVPFE